MSPILLSDILEVSEEVHNQEHDRDGKQWPRKLQAQGAIGTFENVAKVDQQVKYDPPDKQGNI
ncbi:hypothetical protein PM082_008838 [Marasmius tenuissimus]|nr:hypothetical protein PM082_008838 [Marasmius tenuissimus]